MRTKKDEKFKLESVEELLGVVNEESAMDIEISKIQPFRAHPFKVLDDDKMQELIDSISVNGILTPVLVRPLGMDTYEMISGHRRMHAKQIQCKLLLILSEKNRRQTELGEDVAHDTAINRNLQFDSIRVIRPKR